MSRKAHIDLSGELPDFPESSAPKSGEPEWRVKPVPPRLQRRHVDIGDLAPCDTERFIKALRTPAQGIQVGPKIYFFILKIKVRMNAYTQSLMITFFPKTFIRFSWV